MFTSFTKINLLLYFIKMKQIELKKLNAELKNLQTIQMNNAN